MWWLIWKITFSTREYGFEHIKFITNYLYRQAAINGSILNCKNILYISNGNVIDLNICCNTKEEYVKPLGHYLHLLVSIIRLKLMTELTLCKWELFLGHVSFVSKHISIRRVDNLLNYFLFADSFPNASRTGEQGFSQKSPPMVSLVSQPGALQEKNLLCSNYVETTNARKLNKRFQFSYPLLSLQLNLICLNLIMDPFIVKWTKNSYGLNFRQAKLLNIWASSKIFKTLILASLFQLVIEINVINLINV